MVPFNTNYRKKQSPFQITFYFHKTINQSMIKLTETIQFEHYYFAVNK